jgi:hypothetical protein
MATRSSRTRPEGQPLGGVVVDAVGEDHHKGADERIVHAVGEVHRNRGGRPKRRPGAAARPMTG